ncbi:nuclear transport factor 2 family protein [Pedobacter montanisoli]|uniref:Nuclear transport factor 2 family protein n=1 Tax=Pedobacter montanisoli TaxID=2923277 RepID=A0ABS9ZV70_9SPHI|nr:nuclear transport factor 2 family protein [Pedobacter montanisoli]MCJ0742089.1 nuclear transport factor 2 family protein [Pedobacter montanisoli]
MTSNEQLINKFYTAFAGSDFKTMQKSYADEARFNDPVFGNLDATQVRAMWQMLISRGKELKIEFGQIEQQDEERVTAVWQASYLFTATGKKVINNVKSSFEIKEGKIINQTDEFDFKKWAKQAFGFGGWLLGGTRNFKEKVGEQARKNLTAFMKKISQP